MSTPTDKLQTANNPQNPDALDLWLGAAFAKADEVLPGEAFRERVEQAIAERESRSRRYFVLAGAIACATILSILLGGNAAGMLAAAFEPLIQLGQSAASATQGYSTLAELAPSPADMPQFSLPKPGSLEGIASVVLLALAASWLTASAAE